MALIGDGEECVEVPLNGDLQEAGEDLGIPFGCSQGMCGVCQVRVVEGLELLTDKTEKEEEYPLNDGERLCCQMKIETEGEVVIEH